MLNALKPFDFHGVEFHQPIPTTPGEEARASCPFCSHHSQKLYINTETGQFHCKHCDSRGNVYTFLLHVLESALEETTTDDYKNLANDRSGIPWTVFRDHRFAYSRNIGPRWIIPQANSSGAVRNLRNVCPRTPHLLYKWSPPLPLPTRKAPRPRPRLPSRRRMGRSSPRTPPQSCEGRGQRPRTTGSQDVQERLARLPHRPRRRHLLR